MKLVVGLGNPGSKYQATRHNIGFMVIDFWLQKLGKKTKFDAKFNADMLVFKTKSDTVIVAKPMTYMNLSGEAVARIMNYYELSPEETLVVVDDVNLETGKLRLRELGGHGGHNGLRNIIGILKSEQFKRIRIGIDNDPAMPLDHYVLGRFTEAQIAVLKKTVQDAVDAIDLFVSDEPWMDIMTKFNTQA
ncbi:MAG: aminoacyl-tRNA hydrolase [Acholeplasmataceae bacterium]|nr:MAG: aminoacyl-tRNA hydrolase [Acholeplasmataceae bacterium]